MIGVAKIGIAASRGGGGATPVNPDFVSTWDTTQAGSASDTVVLPLLSGGVYSGTIDWGDGGATSSLSYANRTHVYASSGTYTITISGTIEGWQFNNGGDKMKITDISNHGNLTITTNGAFYGCRNMDISATDAPIIATTTIQNMYASTVGLLTGGSGLYKMNTSSVTNFHNSFAGSGFNHSLNGLDVSSCGVQGIVNMFRDAPNFANGGESFDWSISSNIWMDDFVRGTQYNGTLDFGQGVVRLLRTLYNADSFDTSLASLNIAPLTNASSFMQLATGMSTANYDATLVGWEATLQASYPNGSGYTATINIHFGGSQYSSALMNVGEARYNLINVFGWTITDGGAV